MAEKYQEGQAVGINPTAYGPKFEEGTFASYVKIVKARYAPSDYPPDSGYANKITLKVDFLTTNDKTFNRNYSTGVPYGEGLADITPDGKQLISRSPDFRGLGSSSDALLFIRKAIAAGFPSDLIKNDISVFEGHAFLVADAENPSWKGSKPKPYPKEYFAQGWDAVYAERNAQKQAKAGKQNAPKNANAALQSTYTPPKVVVAGDVVSAASGALLEILASSGGTVKRDKIPAKLNEIAAGKGWNGKLRQDITLALWDLTSLAQVAEASGLKVEGDMVSFS